MEQERVRIERVIQGDKMKTEKYRMNNPENREKFAKLWLTMKMHFEKEQ